MSDATKKLKRFIEEHKKLAYSIAESNPVIKLEDEWRDKIYDNMYAESK